MKKDTMSKEEIRKIVYGALVAQVLGTAVALIAAIYLGFSLFYQKLETTKWLALWGFGAIPFFLALVCIGILVYLYEAPENKVRMWIKRILYTDAVLILFVVYATGGVEGNLFSPIFFLIPVCSVALLKHWHDEEIATIKTLVGVTIGCHLLAALLHKVWPIAPGFHSAPLATWITLYVCVMLSAWVSVQNLRYANVDANLGVSLKKD